MRHEASRLQLYGVSHSSALFMQQSLSFTEDVNVRVYGDAAMVTGRYVAKGQENDKAFIRQSRYTDTYIKRQGR